MTQLMIRPAPGVVASAVVRRPARFAALVTATGSLRHGVMAVHHGGAAGAVLMLMAAVCVGCAVHLRTGPNRARAWITVIAMDLAMVVIHFARPRCWSTVCTTI